MTADIEKPLHKRITEIETLLWEIPNLIETRFTRFDAEFGAQRAAIADNTARLVQLERAFTLLQADMRELRGGVTRQLLEQDKRLAALDGRLAAIEEKLGALDTKLSGHDRRFSTLDTKLDAILAKLTESKA